MKVSGLVCLVLSVVVTAPGAWAEDRPDTDGLRAGLAEMLSVLALDSVSVPDQSAEVTRSGSEFQVRLPLTGLVAPAGAAAEAVAHPDGKGGWQVTSLTFPAAGAIGDSIDQSVSYTIGQQSIRGRLDPALKTPSTLAADIESVTLESVAGGQDTAQAFGHITVDGRLTATSTGRLDLFAQNAATNWHSIVRNPGGVRDPAGRQTNSLVRHLDGRLTVADLDRAQGVRLLAAARSLMATGRFGSGPPGEPGQPELSPNEREGLRSVLAAMEGLLAHIDADEVFDGLKFDLGGGSSGSLGRLQLQLKAGAEDQQLNGSIDVAMDEFSLAALSADVAAFVPHHVKAKAVLDNVPIAPLMALLREALAASPDQAMLQQHATALLASPAARAGIESIAFDSGPVRVLGSARFQPRTDGELGADVHLSASGVDALLARVQTRPDLQGIMPLVFIAKGLGRAQGDSIVWDISLGGGPLTVNGIPFGQPSATTR